MNLEVLIPFFGDSPINDAFDDLLEKLQIKARPRGDDDVIFLRTPDKKLTLEFEAGGTFSNDRLIPPRSEGGHLLAGFGVEPGYPGVLPYGLDWTMNHEDIEKLLGTDWDGVGGVAVFFVGSICVTCRFQNAEMKKMKSISVGVAAVYDKAEYGI